MYRMIELVCAAAILIPAFLLLRKHTRYSPRASAWYLIFTLYLSGVYYVTGLPTVQFAVWNVRCNLVPFAGMVADLKNSLLNILLFLPLGFLLPLLWSPFRKLPKTIVFGLAMTCTIEFLQLFTFRATDVNDILTNTLGSFLGYCGFLIFLKYPFLPAPQDTKTDDLIPLILLTAAVMFFAQPLLASLIYQII